MMVSSVQAQSTYYSYRATTGILTGGKWESTEHEVDLIIRTNKNTVTINNVSNTKLIITNEGTPVDEPLFKGYLFSATDQRLRRLQVFFVVDKKSGDNNMTLFYEDTFLSYTLQSSPLSKF